MVALSRKILFGTFNFHVPLQSRESPRQPDMAANAERMMQRNIAFLIDVVLATRSAYYSRHPAAHLRRLGQGPLVVNFGDRIGLRRFERKSTPLRPYEANKLTAKS